MSKRISVLTAFCLMILGSIAVFGDSLYQTTNIQGRVILKEGDGLEINGQPADVNSTVASGSTATTAKGSSAVVSLGKLGRVEIMESTTVKLDFAESGLTATLSAGRVRISSSAATTPTVKTNDADVVGDAKRASQFTVDVTCGDTLVSVQRGTVELRAGSSVKQIAAGNQDTAGTATPGCRP